MSLCFYSSMALGFCIYDMNHYVEVFQKSGIDIPDHLALQSASDMEKAKEKLKADILQKVKDGKYSSTVAYDFNFNGADMDIVLEAVIKNVKIKKIFRASQVDDTVFSECQDSVTPLSLEPKFHEELTDKLPSFIPFATSPCQRAANMFAAFGGKLPFKELRFYKHCQQKNK